MKKIFRVAMENDEVKPNDEVAPAAEVKDADDQQIEAAEVENDNIIAEVDSVDENSSILDSTEAVAGTITKLVESDKGLDETNVDLVAPALEHFYDRTGFIDNKMSSLSLESFADSKTSLENTKIVLEELVEFNTKLSDGLSIAQEGIFSRLGNSVKLMFTNQEKIHNKITEATAKANEKGLKTETIKEPGWGRSFAIIGKKELTPADVISYVEKYNKLLMSGEFTKLIKEYTALLNKLTDSVSKSRFIAKDEAVKEIQDLSKELNSLSVKVDSVLSSDLTAAKNDPSFKPLDAASLKKLSSVAISIVSNAETDKLIEHVSETVANTNVTIWSEANTRLAGGLAADMRATQRFIEQLNPIMHEFLMVVYARNRICFACANYIKASVA